LKSRRYRNIFGADKGSAGVIIKLQLMAQGLFNIVMTADKGYNRNKKGAICDTPYLFPA
jgi:hypothetical protein